jgi:hypothetical protein
MSNKARSKLDLSYPRTHTWEEARTTPPTTMSHYKQARRRRNDLKMLKIEKEVEK